MPEPVACIQRDHYNFKTTGGRMPYFEQGRLEQHVTCQIVARGLQGYRPQEAMTLGCRSQYKMSCVRGAQCLPRPLFQPAKPRFFLSLRRLSRQREGLV